MQMDKMTVKGLRGFASEQALEFGKPNGDPGGGLTILVGPNNGGKSTLIEGLQALAQPGNTPPTFSEGKRNGIDGFVRISAELSDGHVFTLKTKDAGGSQTEFVPAADGGSLPEILVLPSRRYFDPFFGKTLASRESYVSHNSPPVKRGQPSAAFAGRLFAALDNRAAFDHVLSRVIDPVPDWTIEQSDHGQYYMKIRSGDSRHSSDGMGEGLVSLFFIIDALRDSAPGAVIAIDEPELSLHPALQKKLAVLLSEYASDRQIVYATHSPYFVVPEAILAGAKLARVCCTEQGCRIHQLCDSLVTDLRADISGSNINNPHVFGLSAREAFFLQDGVILVEGQEDVVVYRRLLRDLSRSLKGEFFGWGVGGAGRMKTMASLLKQLGFERVVGLLDGDKRTMLPDLQGSFPNFKFLAIPAKDVRDKPARPCKSTVDGLTDSAGALKANYQKKFSQVLDHVEAYLSVQPVAH